MYPSPRTFIGLRGVGCGGGGLTYKGSFIVFLPNQRVSPHVRPGVHIRRVLRNAEPLTRDN